MVRGNFTVFFLFSNVFSGVEETTGPETTGPETTGETIAKGKVDAGPGTGTEVVGTEVKADKPEETELTGLELNLTPKV
jgi:hypothetical protein